MIKGKFELDMIDVIVFFIIASIAAILSYVVMQSLFVSFLFFGVSFTFGLFVSYD